MDPFRRAAAQHGLVTFHQLVGDGVPTSTIDEWVSAGRLVRVQPRVYRVAGAPVTWEQRVLAGDPKLEASQVIPSFPFARYAEMLGFKGIRVDSPDQVADAWDEALAERRPVVYEAITDPEVPPLPPHIRFEQATSLVQAMAKGEPHTLRIAMQSLKGKLQEFTTR